MVKKSGWGIGTKSVLPPCHQATRDLGFISGPAVVLNGSRCDFGGPGSVRPGVPDGSPHRDRLFGTGRDMSDRRVEPVLQPCPVQFEFEFAGVADLLHARPSPLTCPNRFPRLLGRRRRPAELLGDRQGGHELAGGVGPHLWGRLSLTESSKGICPAAVSSARASWSRIASAPATPGWHSSRPARRRVPQPLHPGPWPPPSPPARRMSRPPQHRGANAPRLPTRRTCTTDERSTSRRSAASSCWTIVRAGRTVFPRCAAWGSRHHSSSGGRARQAWARRSKGH